ncbi:hypothetical protein CDL15_Pgr000350 [Punica granatum]|uniref:Uncharacterized protein n=1 Tax=Punica granatum TaxID=22663 RepID=A0A218XSK4_PUNGR|nr:hypothetical protein CDL15_Pgr000350 [Punica granatum]
MTKMFSKFSLLPHPFSLLPNVIVHHLPPSSTPPIFEPTLSSFPILIKTTLPSAKDVTIFVLLLPLALFMEEDDLREVREKIAIICRFATLSPVASRRQGDLLLSASSVRLSRTEVLWSQASIGNSELGLNLQIMKLKSETLG